MDEAGRKTDKELIGEASDWLAALDSGSTSAGAFEAWRDADPRHASAFAQVASTWGQLGQLRGFDPAEPAAAPEDAPAAEQPSRRQFLTRAAAAAAVVVAAGGGAAWLYDGRQHIETAVGEQRTVPMPDGSTIQLNTDTQLAWIFSATRRVVWMAQGEAAFSVVADLARPFLVHAGGAMARLDSGRFNVRFGEAGPQFMTATGEGLVDLAGSMMKLAPMHAVLATAQGLRQTEVGEMRAADAMAWQNGEIVFEDMPLREAVAEFNRYLDRKIVLGDPAIGATRLGGRFRIDDPRSFLSALNSAFGIRAQAGNREVLLTRR